MKKVILALSICCLAAGTISHAEEKKGSSSSPSPSPTQADTTQFSQLAPDQSTDKTIEWFTQHKQKRSEIIQACASNNSIQISTAECINAIKSAVASP